MLRLIKRLLGLKPPPDQTSSRDSGPEHESDDEIFRFVREAREKEAERQKVTGPYFDALNLMQRRIKERDYPAAAALARKNIRHVQPFVRWDISEDGTLHVQSIPCLEVGGTMLALAGDSEGLQELAEVVRTTPELERWADVPARHLESLRLIEAILAEVSRSPGCKQNSMKKRLGESDGRRIGTLIKWLEKAGRLRRVKEGRTYTLWIPGHEQTPEPIAMPELDVPALRRRGGAVKIRNLDLKNVPYIPLPRAPSKWEERENRPGPEPYPPAEDFFEVPDASRWRIASVEKVPMEERPDTAFRQFYPMAEGLILVDDLGNAEAHPGAPASALLFDRAGQKVRSAALAHDVYRLDVNPLGHGMIGLSRQSLLHVYGRKLEPLVEYNLREAPEVGSLVKRHEIEQSNLKNHLRTVALAHDNSRFVVTAVDEAWCLSVEGEALWGLKFPLKEGWQEVATPVEDYGTSAEISEALATLELSLPVTPAKVKARYRELAKKWHPDLNPHEPSATARMQAITIAAESLTGIDLFEERRTAGMRYEKFAEQREVTVAGAEITLSFGVSGSALQAADWIYAAGFAGTDHGAFLAGYSGKIVQVDATGAPIRVYDIGAVPRRIADTGDYLYFLTDTRLYVLNGEALYAVVDMPEAGDLIVAETGFGLLEKKRFRWFNEDGSYTAEVVTKHPIRRVYWSTNGLTVETRQRRARFTGAPTWWEGKR